MFFPLADAFDGAHIQTYGEGNLADTNTRPGMLLTQPCYAAEERQAFLLTDADFIRFMEGQAV